jgi:hypothetical protein
MTLHCHLFRRPRQFALNALSSHMVELPPLTSVELRHIVAGALEQHYGGTLAVRAVCPVSISPAQLTPTMSI